MGKRFQIDGLGILERADAVLEVFIVLDLKPPTVHRRGVPTNGRKANRTRERGRWMLRRSISLYSRQMAR